LYGLNEIEDELREYRAKGTKDSLHFLHNKPLPIELIKKIIELKSKQKQTKTKTNNLNPEVTKLLNDLNLPLINCVQILRETILKSNQNLEENIKWNSPNYTLNGNDLITLRVQPSKTNVQIIFHRGAKVKSQPEAKIIPEDSKLLLWKSNDRAIATFTNISEITNNMDLIEKWVKIWLEYKDCKE
jgi:uncharacterized protein YdhG (YjbR/CyaY superfamily)